MYIHLLPLVLRAVSVNTTGARAFWRHDVTSLAGSHAARSNSVMLHCPLLKATRPEYPPGMAPVYPGGRPSSLPWNGTESGI